MLRASSWHRQHHQRHRPHTHTHIKPLHPKSWERCGCNDCEWCGSHSFTLKVWTIRETERFPLDFHTAPSYPGQMGASNWFARLSSRGSDICPCRFGLWIITGQDYTNNIRLESTCSKLENLLAGEMGCKELLVRNDVEQTFSVWKLCTPRMFWLGTRRPNIQWLEHPVLPTVEKQIVAINQDFKILQLLIPRGGWIQGLL